MRVCGFKWPSVLWMLVWVCACSAAIQCSNPPPGVAKIVKGVDITNLDLNPLKISGSASSGFKSPVLNFTCNLGRTWRNPHGVDYQLPDQIWHMTSLPGGWLGADVSIYKTYREVRKSMTKKVGGKGLIWKFSFSASGSYSNMQETIVNTSRYISDVSAFESATSVDVTPSWILGMDLFAQMFVDQMITGTFKSNPAPYRKFIEEFGTHYFSSGNFGGYIRAVYETNTNYFSHKSDKEVKAEAKASFLKIVSGNGGHVSQTTKVDEKFLKESSVAVKYYGGETNLLVDVQDGMQKWQPTVDNDPWLFSGKLQPISDLISDKAKKASMVEAVADHVLRTYLDELLRLIHTAKPKTRNRDALDKLESRVRGLKDKAFLVEDEVEKVAEELDEFLKAPVCENVDLASHGFAYSERTMAGTVSSISLNRRVSKSHCRLGSSFGKKGQKVWVDNGCEGNFMVCSEPVRNPAQYCVDVDLASHGKKYAERTMEFHVSAITLNRKVSRSGCDLASSFGRTGHVVWVDKGCRGNFRVCS